MKPAQLREISTKELDLKVREIKDTLFRLRFQSSVGQLDNPKKFREMKREIARILTILNERKRADKPANAKAAQ